MVSHPLFTLENIYRAFMQCRKRKRRTINALIFEENLEENLVALHHELNNGSYHPGAYQAFLVEKPKRREIFAADFRDRVVHHILVHHLEKKWEPIFIYDSYACRQEKGTHKAVYRLRSFTLQATCNQTQKSWYLQLDIKGFFICIDREILFERLFSKERDPMILWLIRTLVFNDPLHACRFRKATRDDFLSLPEHKTLFKATPGCGLPIGNLTSQFFANVYLDLLDQYVKHQLKVRYYVRYCDDFVLLSDHPEQLLAWKNSIQQFLRVHLRLTLNNRTKLRPITDGIDFLGYIVRPNYLLVRRRVIGGLYERLLDAEQQLIQKGMIQSKSGRSVFPWPWSLLQKIYQWLESYQGHLRHAASHRLWCDLLHRFGWLNEYFKWKKYHPCFNYPIARYVRSYYSQKHFFIKQFPNHIILIRLGKFWEITVDHPHRLPQQNWYNKKFTCSFIAHIKQILWKHPVPVVWIEETGQRINTIAQRTLTERWDFNKQNTVLKLGNG